jgi:hypothetical protein
MWKKISAASSKIEEQDRRSLTLPDLSTSVAEILMTQPQKHLRRTGTR